jgi:magnesium transporter
LTRLRPADRAEAFSDLDDHDQAVILPQLGISDTADLLEELEGEEAIDVAETLPTDLLADVLDEMEPDEAADILGDLPPDRAASALAEMEDRQEVLPLLSHPDKTAGGLMTTSFIALRGRTTAAEAIEFLREMEPESETPYYLYVVDAQGRLTGVVGLRDLIVADPATPLSQIMDEDILFVSSDADQEDVARTFARYDLAAVPVVGPDRRLEGVITYDDIVDVLEEEATEDVYRLANVADSDLSIHSPIRMAVRRRLPWLYLNTLTALFASWVISHFESLIAQVAVLAVFQSVVAGMGGNVATQSLAITVRALALGDIELRAAWRTLLKEAVTGLLHGAAVGVVVGFGVYLWRGSATLGLILGLALLGNMLVAEFVGTLVPLVLKGLSMDPALASSVLVTAVTDSVGFALFLGLASLTLYGGGLAR